MKIKSFESNHPSPRCFLLWNLELVEQLKSKEKLLNLFMSKIAKNKMQEVFKGLEVLELELISFISYMDDIIEREENER